MSTYKNKINFFDTDEGAAVKLELKHLVADKSYNTEPIYSANVLLHPDHLMSFFDKHLAYLRSHPAIDPKQYLANLRLMTRIR